MGDNAKALKMHKILDTPYMCCLICKLKGIASLWGWVPFSMSPHFEVFYVAIGTVSSPDEYRNSSLSQINSWPIIFQLSR